MKNYFNILFRCGSRTDKGEDLGLRRLSDLNGKWLKYSFSPGFHVGFYIAQFHSKSIVFMGRNKNIYDLRKLNYKTKTSNLWLDKTVKNKLRRKRVKHGLNNKKNNLDEPIYLSGVVRTNGKSICIRESSDPRSKILDKIDRDYLNRAFDGDVVIFNVSKTSDNNRRNELSKVISIQKSVGNPTFVGKIEGNPQNGFYVMSTFSQLYPEVLVSTEDPFLDHHRNDSGYIGKFSRWFQNSNLPIVQLIHRFRYVDDIVENETLSIMIQEGLDDFLLYSEEEINSNVSQLKKIQNRLDLTSECIFTIDPESAKDFDDAISIKHLTNDLFQVGVHIADVSHFVKPGSEIDLRARKLCLTTYMVHRAFHMLPTSLSSDLCSLNPGCNRYAVSLLMTFDQDFKLVDKWFGRTIINSCARLSYKQAQNLLMSTECPDEIGTTIYNGFKISDISTRIKEIFKLTNHIRKERFGAGGAFSFDNQEINFDLDLEKLPVRVYPYVTEESHHLIEELMILANQIVGKIIFQSFPSGSIFRVNNSPRKGYDLKQRINVLAKHGYEVEPYSSKSFSHSLCQISKKFGKETYDAVRKYICIVIKPAMYKVCTPEHNHDENHFRHYCLNTSLYTHFTSPIRRYPDILVHRMLINSLNGYGQSIESLDSLCEVINKCNMRHSQQSYADSRSLMFNLWLYIKQNGPIKVRACIIPSQPHPNMESGFIIIHPYSLKFYLVNCSMVKKIGYFNNFDAMIDIKYPDAPFTHYLEPFKFYLPR